MYTENPDKAEKIKNQFSNSIYFFNLGESYEGIKMPKVS